MACRFGGTFVTPILAVAGLVAAGAAGYKMINGCGSSADQAATTALVSDTSDKQGSCGLCPGEATTECAALVQTVNATEPSTCGSEKGAAKVSTVASAPKADDCCASKGEAIVKTVAAAPKADECCASKGEANVKTVAVAEVKKDSCCPEGKTAAATEKACKEGTDGCTGDGKEGCCGGCEGEKKADGTVATSGK